jgi:hypothetical protein
MRFPFFDSDARRASRRVRQLFDGAIATLGRDPDIAAVASRLRLELLLADAHHDFEDWLVREMRGRVRPEEIEIGEEL